MEAVDDDMPEMENGQNLDGSELQGDSFENSSDSSGVIVSDNEDSKTGMNENEDSLEPRGQDMNNFEGSENEDDDDLEILEERAQRQEMSEDNNDEGDDDIMEITEADPLGAEAEDRSESDVIQITRHTIPNNDMRKNVSITSVTRPSPSSSVSSSQAGQSATKQNNLVIVDTNSILSGRGPIPVQNNSPNMQVSRNMGMGGGSNYQMIPSKTPNFKIPDDAFLIEAPSFIVPYVFEQKGESTLKNTLKELEEAIKKEKGDDYVPPPEKKKPENEDYFDTPVGKLLSSVGMNLVQEYVQADLLKMQKKKAEKERMKSRGGFVPLQTQQSIISLKQNLEESKENNEPFRHRMKKCELCNFKTESELVMNTHLETPHMKNYSYRCNFCTYTTRYPHEILSHMEANHKVRPRLERAPAYHQCPNCQYEDNSKAKLSRHIQGCTKRFKIEKNLEPPQDWDTPAKLRISKNRLMSQGLLNQAYMFANQQQQQQQQQQQRVSNHPNLQPKFLPGQKVNLPPLLQAPRNKQLPGLMRQVPNMMGVAKPVVNPQLNRGNGLYDKHRMMQRGGHAVPTHNMHMMNNTIPAHSGSLQMRNLKSGSQPSISITPLPRQSSSPQQPIGGQNKAQAQGKTSFVICEICDGYIKDLDQLRNHMQWIHKVKIHPKMIYNKPPLNCQKCQFRFFTDQGLERHLLGSHGLVTSSMQDAANKGQDNGRCPLCGKVYQWKLLAHVAKDHNVTLKPAHLSYKCTVCTATFGMYKLFESHVYSAHSMNSKKNERKPTPAPPMAHNRGQIQVVPRQVHGGAQNSFRPLKINDEITIIPQPAANSFRNRGSLTITPHPARGRGNVDDGIQIIEIDDGPQRNGRKENGDMRGRLPISDSILRKRNLEISVCGSSDGMDDFQQMPMKRLRQN